VALVHAFPLNSQMWAPQTEDLSAGHRFIAVDLMGFGLSDAPEDSSRYSMDAFADQVKAALDDSGAERVVLCGLSMGGYISFAFWRRHAHMVAGLVLADTKAEADDDAARERRTAQQSRVAGEGIDGVADALISGPLLSDATRSAKPDVVDRVRRLAKNPAAGYIGALEALKNRPDSTPDLAGIDVPALVVVGEDDTLTPPAAAEHMHSRLRASRLRVIPEAGHLSSLEAPASFNAALASFLDEL
jgi:pimeloyl-ACP methyl ester carboxylesterase